MALYVGEQFHPAAVVFFLVLGTIVLLSGVLGNSLLLLVLARYRPLWHAHNVFIASLTVADLLIIVLTLPLTLADLVLGHYPIGNEMHCRAFGFVVTSSFYVSVLSLVGISLNRYLRVCYSQRFLRWFTTRNNVCVCLLTWLIAFSANISSMIGDTSPFKFAPKSHACLGRGESSFAMSAFLLTSAVLIAFFNFAIFRQWAASKRKPKTQLSYIQLVRREKDNSISQTFEHATAENDSDSIPTGTESTGRKRHSIPMVQFVCDSNDTNAVKDFDMSAGLHSADLLNRTSLLPNILEGEICAKPLMTTCEAACSHGLVAHVDSNTMVCAKTIECLSHSLVQQSINGLPSPASVLNDFGNEFADDATDSERSSSNANTTSNREDISPLNGRDGNKQNQPTLAKDIDSHEPPQSCRRKNMHKEQDGQSKIWTLTEAERRLIRSLLVISVVLFVLFLQFAAVGIANALLSVPAEVVAMSAFLLSVNSAVNWIIYGAMNTSYRQAYKHTLPCFKRCP